jgi:FkbM family methyltransferase
LIHLASQIILRIGNRLKLTGAEEIGLGKLKLNCDSVLGKKGKELIVPRDDVIYQKVKLSGHWELIECQFLSEGLVNLRQREYKKYALLDLGANTGLVSLATTNLANTGNDILMVEPLPKHIEAIVHNLAEVKANNKIVVFPFALGSESGEFEIYSENSNKGNSSIIKSLVPQNNFTSSKVTLVQAAKFYNENLEDYAGFVIKSDMQGMDSAVLSSFPKIFWDKCERAVIEIWAINDVLEDDCNKLADFWRSFDYVSWSPNVKEKLSFEDLRRFWLSKSGKEKNLFLSRKINSLNK